MQEAASVIKVHSVSVPWRPSESHGLGLEQAEEAGKEAEESVPSTIPYDHGFRVTHPTTGVWVPLTAVASAMVPIHIF